MFVKIFLGILLVILVLEEQTSVSCEYSSAEYSSLESSSVESSTTESSKGLHSSGKFLKRKDPSAKSSKRIHPSAKSSKRVHSFPKSSHHKDLSSENTAIEYSSIEYSQKKDSSPENTATEYSSIEYTAHKNLSPKNSPPDYSSSEIVSVDYSSIEYSPPHSSSHKKLMRALESKPVPLPDYEFTYKTECSVDGKFKSHIKSHYFVCKYDIKNNKWFKFETKCENYPNTEFNVTLQKCA